MIHKIYHLGRTDDYSYDDYYECVVIASSQQEALDIAKTELSNDYGAWPLEDKLIDITLLGLAIPKTDKGVYSPANLGA